MNLLYALDALTHLNYQIMNYPLIAQDVTNSFIVKLLALAMVLKAILVFLIALILFPGVLIVYPLYLKIKLTRIGAQNVFANTA